MVDLVYPLNGAGEVLYKESGRFSVPNRVLGAIRFRRMLPFEDEASRIAAGVVRMEYCPRKERRAFIRRECSLCVERPWRNGTR